MSPDGRFIVFQSEANDLVPGDGTSGPNTGDIFVKDMQTGMTKRASVDTGGGDPNGFSFGPRISADGTVVAFGSHASDLVQADGNAEPDVFVRNLTRERRRARASTPPAATTTPGYSVTASR